jgi:hypothetical protein
VLQHGLTNGAHTAAGAADAFGHTYLWVLALTAVAVAPALVLARAERDRPVATAAIVEAAA